MHAGCLEINYKRPQVTPNPAHSLKSKRTWESGTIDSLFIHLGPPCVNGSLYFSPTQIQASFKSQTPQNNFNKVIEMLGFTATCRRGAIPRTTDRSGLHFLVSSSDIYHLAWTNRRSKAGRVASRRPIGACARRGNVARQRWRLVPICWTSDVFFSIASGAKKVVGGRVGPL